MGIFLVIGSTSPSMLIIFIFIIAGFVATFKKQILLANQLKKIHTVAQAPIFSNISEVFNGASIVKSY